MSSCGKARQCAVILCAGNVIQGIAIDCRGIGQCRTVQFDAVKVSCVQVLSPSVVPGIGIAISRVLSFRQNISGAFRPG